jgi:hypothetical protein
METLMHIGAGIIMTVGFGLFAWGAYIMFQCLKVARWRKAAGAIRACEIKESIDSEGYPVWCVEVVYSYGASGKQYSGDRIAYGYMKSNSHKHHLALYDRLSTAQTVIVRYNPNNPSESALTYGLHSTPILLVTGGLVMGFGTLSVEIANEMLNWVSSACILAVAVLLGLDKLLDKRMCDRIDILECKTAGEPTENEVRKHATPQH